MRPLFAVLQLNKGADWGATRTGPYYAIPKVLEQVGIRKEDVDLYEINEAFASMYVYCVENLGLDVDKVNVNGGAIGLG